VLIFSECFEFSCLIRKKSKGETSRKEIPGIIYIFAYLKSMLMSTDQELVTKVKNVIEQIRPYLQADGGDVEFVELMEDKTVNIRLLGMCGNCPHSRMTLKNGIETAVRRVLPEIRAVESVGEDLAE
jgi:Fe-S cluster biogenesis protein NfuA